MQPYIASILTFWLALSFIGAKQSRTSSGSLTTADERVLVPVDGGLALVRRGTTKDFSLARGWSISAPHVRTSGGKYLAGEQTESGVTLRLVEKPDDSAKWVVEVVSSFSPRGVSPGRGFPTLLEGNEGQTFRLSIFAGKHKGKYLAIKPVAEGAAAKDEVRELQLVEQAKEALSFVYVSTNFSYKIRER